MNGSIIVLPPIGWMETILCMYCKYCTEVTKASSCHVHDFLRSDRLNFVCRCMYSLHTALLYKALRVIKKIVVMISS